MKNIICPCCGKLIGSSEIGRRGYKMPICKMCEKNEKA